MTAGNHPFWWSNEALSLSDTRFPVTDEELSLSLSNLSLSGVSPAPSGPASNDGFLQWLRIQDAVNGQMNSHPTAQIMPSWTYPTAGIYQENDLFGKQQYPGIGFLQNRRRGAVPVDPYMGYNRQRALDLPHVPLRYLRGSMVDLARNQRGCRLLQANLEGPTEEEVDWVLAEVLYHVDDIMCDQFGNYVFQKVVKVANERQRNQISMVLSGAPFRLVSICLNPHGTRAVQKFLETINTQQQISLVMSALCPGTVKLSTDPNGQHVMQHCLKRFPFDDNKYLIKEIIANCFEISTNKSGCCVMQTCVDFSRDDCRKDLIFEIISNAVHLADDPYGNYVVQHLLDLKTPDITEELLRQLEGYHVALACNKYASNVVQKCMEETQDEHSLRVIRECLTSPHISRLLNDPYGNYVVQTALRRFKGPILKSLLNVIKENAASMRNNMYGKKILDLLQEMKLGRV